MDHSPSPLLCREVLMGLQTPLYRTHVAEGAKIVDFGGWDMPLHYGSQIEEHHAVRRDAGIFDVSHMCVVDLSGARVRDFLRYLLANDVGKLKNFGKALYSCMLNEAGGVIDDLIVYYLQDNGFRLVVNAGRRDTDLAWIRRHALPFVVEVRERSDLAMLAVQGPNARSKTAERLAPQWRQALELPLFTAADCGDWLVARTGYTGEDGFEIMLPASAAVAAWESLRAQGIAAAGLGARDTLRLEAGMNLYGNDMDESTHPLESGLTWTVAWAPAEREFIGRDALQAIHRDDSRQLVGLLLQDRGVLRAHQQVLCANGRGDITSGTFSPSIGRSIALARLPAGPRLGDSVQVDVRGKLLAAQIVKTPFVRNGQIQIDVDPQEKPA
jgi:aminomethyltransferase